MQIRLTFDGEPVALPADTTVADLLRRMDLSPEILSVVRNGQVVRRAAYDECLLHDGDELSAVIQVGGG